MKNLLAVTKESLLKENLLAATEEVAEVIVEQEKRNPFDKTLPKRDLESGYGAQLDKATMKAAGERALVQKERDMLKKIDGTVKQLALLERKAIETAAKGEIKAAANELSKIDQAYENLISFVEKNRPEVGAPAIIRFREKNKKNLKNLRTADAFFDKGKSTNDLAQQKAFYKQALRIFPQHGLAQKEIKDLGVTKDPKSVSGKKPDPAAAAPAAKKAEPAKTKDPLAAVPIFNYDIERTGKFQGQRLEIWGDRDKLFYGEESGFKRRRIPVKEAKVLLEAQLDLNKFMKNFGVDSWEDYKQKNRQDLSTGNIKPIHLYFFAKEFSRNKGKDTFKKIDMSKLSDSGNKVAAAIVKARTDLAKFLNDEYYKLAKNRSTISAALLSGGYPKVPVKKGNILFVPNSAFSKGPDAGGPVSYFTTAEATLAKRLGLITKGSSGLIPAGVTTPIKKSPPKEEVPLPKRLTKTSKQPSTEETPPVDRTSTSMPARRPAKKRESEDLKDIKKTKSEKQKARKLKKLVNKMAPRFLGKEEKGWKTPRTELFNELEWRSARRSLGRKDYDEVIKLIEMAENRTAKQFGRELEDLSKMRIGQDLPIPPFLVKHTFKTKPKMRENFPGVDLDNERSLKGWLIYYEDGAFGIARERAYED